MRPPHFCGGNPAKWVYGWLIKDGFNEAPAFLRGKPAAVIVGFGGLALASMRPPHFCGGNPHLAVVVTNHDGASMRPPHFCGGNRDDSGTSVSALEVLQ